jgi:hypothetical protein
MGGRRRSHRRILEESGRDGEEVCRGGRRRRRGEGEVVSDGR